LGHELVQDMHTERAVYIARTENHSLIIAHKIPEYISDIVLPVLFLKENVWEKVKLNHTFQKMINFWAHYLPRGHDSLEDLDDSDE
jgi:hypothetical protein